MGDEKIDGVDTKHISGSVKDLTALLSTFGDTSLEGTIDLWISTADTPYVLMMKVAGIQADTKVNSVVKWSKFNQDLGIKAPPTGN